MARLYARVRGMNDEFVQRRTASLKSELYGLQEKIAALSEAIHHHALRRELNHLLQRRADILAELGEFATAKETEARERAKQCA